ncbi:MAG TPA: efflux RND transporter periplasmic adaptor subunit [Tepidisphaeraceae bacterium]|jgi:RND family efflux transporter MFP subunit
MLIRLLALLAVVGILIGALFFSQLRHEPLKVSGFIEADEIRVGSRVGGRVMRVEAVEGHVVKVGDLLIELEPYDLNERLAEARAKIEQGKAQQQLAQVSVDRLKPAFEHGAASKEEMDSALAQLALAKAGVEAAEAAAKAIERQIGELVVKSPVNGTVEAVDLQPGDLVAANAPVLSLMDTSNLWVRAYVPENHLDIEIGRKVIVTVDSFPKREFHAHVSFLARQAEFTPGNVQTPEERSKQVFRMKVTLDEGLDVLRPGMSADVWLEDKR